MFIFTIVKSATLTRESHNLFEVRWSLAQAYMEPNSIHYKGFYVLKKMKAVTPPEIGIINCLIYNLEEFILLLFCFVFI